MYLGLCNVRFVYFTTEELPRKGPKLASCTQAPPHLGQGRAGPGYEATPKFAGKS